MAKKTTLKRVTRRPRRAGKHELESLARGGKAEFDYDGIRVVWIEPGDSMHTCRVIADDVIVFDGPAGEAGPVFKRFLADVRAHRNWRDIAAREKGWKRWTRVN